MTRKYRKVKSSVQDIRDESFIKHVAKCYNLPDTVVRKAMLFPFKFVTHVMRDPTDTAPIYLFKLGTFSVRPMFEEDKKMTLKRAKEIASARGKFKRKLIAEDFELYKKLYGDYEAKKRAYKERTTTGGNNEDTIK